MLQVTLYGKPDCPLCDELKADLAALQPQIGFVLEERNIEADAADFERYRYLIPVLDIAGGPVLTPPHEFHAVQQALLAARDAGSRDDV